MIRKAIIVGMTLGAVGSMALHFFSFYRPIIYDRGWVAVYLHPLTLNIILYEGRVQPPDAIRWWLTEPGLQAQPSSPLHPIIPVNRSPRYFQFWRRFAGNTTCISVPLLGLAILFSSYPTIAFIRGPLRRWRRKKKGLCLKCGYDLTGNVTGVCSECGVKVAHNLDA